MNLRILTTLALASGLLFTGSVVAQSNRVEFPPASPGCTLKQRVGLTDIEITYSRPGVKGRDIFGGLVPFDKVWRTGANNATKVVFSTAVKLNGTDIPAGTYALFTIPGKTEWTIIINKGAAQWGAFAYDEKVDVARFKAKPAKLAQSVENFNIEFDQLRDESAILTLSWDKTSVPIKVELDVKTALVPQIEAVMASDQRNKPYYPAATFYYEQGLDLQKAKEWVNAAVAAQDRHYINHLKAKILAKLGEKDAAIAAAKHSSELAVKANDPGYVKMNDDLIAGLK